MKSSPLVFVGIAPHPPVMIPEVGGAQVAEVRASIAAMRDLSDRVKASGAQSVIFISPHAPLENNTFVAYDGAQLRGDFANFRASQTIVEAPLDSELLDAIEEAAAGEQFGITRLEPRELDHGTAVPLYFLLRNGWRGAVVALGYCFLPDEDHVRFGGCIRRAVERVERPIALIASGDLSHRLTPDAPAGYYPKARRFDEEVVEAIRQNSAGRILHIDRSLRRLAGECGYRSMLVALGACDYADNACEVIHYEAPFGVGYLVAQLSSASLN